MKTKIVLAALVTAVGLSGFHSHLPWAEARPTFIVMDASRSENKPERFGYKVRAEKQGNDTRFSISLTPKASVSYRSAKIFFVRKLQDQPDVIVTTWSRRSKPEKKISFSVPTRFLRDCLLQIDSGFLRRQDASKMNFSGYRLRLDNIPSK